ncbi:undecaprenyl-phosphate glucose phosphotransferase [Bacteroides rodentium]
MKQVLQFNNVIKFVIIFGDLSLLNIIFISLYYIFDYQTQGNESTHSLPQLLVRMNLVYLLCNYYNGVVLHRRIIRPEQIVRRAFRNTILHAVVFISLNSLAEVGAFSFRFFVCFYGIFFIILTTYRLTCRYLLKQYRKYGGNSCSITLVGDNKNMIELYREMTQNSTVGFRVNGYFSDSLSRNFPENVPYLGHPKEVVAYLAKHHTDQIYCSLSSDYSYEIVPIINYCENHLIRFYNVPNIRNYVHRRMYFDMFGNIPILSIRKEPLAQVENRMLKRTFDIFFSLLFLCTVFPFIYLIIGAAIKLSSPGPIFFKQKRSGENGKEFWCYKFRSMRVNVDSDKVQATIDDPRKTKIGDFMRRTSIDELPQFINVLLGQMSVVGPRPHMLKHTEEYSRLIDKYMVRHLVKPGITGWAQVTGYRGETKELWQMEGRVERDVWYLEHWTFLLDIYIIYKTVKNAVQGDKEAY